MGVRNLNKLHYADNFTLLAEKLKSSAVSSHESQRANGGEQKVNIDKLMTINTAIRLRIDKEYIEMVDHFCLIGLDARI